MQTVIDMRGGRDVGASGVSLLQRADVSYPIVALEIVAVPESLFLLAAGWNLLLAGVPYGFLQQLLGLSAAVERLFAFGLLAGDGCSSELLADAVCCR